MIFMFATTEMQKVPADDPLARAEVRLRKITLEELIDPAREDLQGRRDQGRARARWRSWRRRGEGSVRDSLSLLDQIIAFSGRSISVADVATVLGLSDTNFFARLVSLIGSGDHGAILEALQEAADSGRDFKMLYRDLLNFVRNLLLMAGGANEALLGVSPEDLATIRSVAEEFSYNDLLAHRQSPAAR